MDHENIMRLKLAREALIRAARKTFWSCCQALAPDFYVDGRKHLEELCKVLQALYEGRIIRFNSDDTWKIVDSTVPLHNFEVCKKLMTNLPP